jgi:hypothetical protein
VEIARKGNTGPKALHRIGRPYQINVNANVPAVASMK